MTDNKIFKVNAEWSKNALINAHQYESDYTKSFPTIIPHPIA